MYARSYNPGETYVKQTQESTAAQDVRLIRWCAILCIGALVAHAIDVPDHLREWWGFSTFAVVVGAFQFFYAFLLLLQPWRYDESGGSRENALHFGRGNFMLGIVLAAAELAGYLVSRTIGLPFIGPQAVREPVTILSLLPPAEDAVLLALLVLLWRRARRPLPVHA